MDQDHLEWKKEQSRIDDIKDLLEEKKREITDDTGEIKEEILKIRKEFWEDVTVNIDEPDDAVETYASIKQQAELLSERERSFGQFDQLVKRYDRQQDSPYFGRIDFTEDGNTESVYIGIGSLMNKQKEDFLIYDWRAPISSMYYDYSPGPASYETPEGEIAGEIELKRQFIIRNGNLRSMFDTGVTIGDELLQEALSGQATVQMKGIVATIQKEQNRIIRYQKHRPLVVQGAAGSGKTSAAMQRIAYLLYRDRKTITADQILLFSPNHMFMSYVSSVLPELGEENMRQTTFQEYAAKRLDVEYELETPFEQLEYLLDQKSEVEHSQRVNGIQLKASLAFKHKVDEYIEQLEEAGMLFRNVKFRGKKVADAHQIRKYFYQLEGRIPNRIEQVKEWLLQKLDTLEKRERAKDWPVEEAAFLDKKDYLDAFQKLEHQQKFDEDSFDDFEREQDLLVKEVVRRRIAPLRKKIKSLRFIHMRKLYHQFYQSSSQDGMTIEQWEGIVSYTQKAIENRRLFAEDITPYLYLQDQIEGRKINTVIRHVFIDEAQDYSPFQLEYIQQLFPNARFNFLGDFNQAIHTLYSNVPSVLEGSERIEEIEMIRLQRSYRSTKPIVEFTKALIPNGDEIEAFNREGRKPRLYKVEEDRERVEKIVNLIRERQEEGCGTVAVLTKTVSEAFRLYVDLNNALDIRLIYKDSQTFETGVLVLPAYLAKGIEFDAVIIPDASEEMYNQEEERKLFYTACTRAMHELDLFYKNKKSFFLERVPSDLYEQV
ncbi:helicase [Halobacillus fulvus]|nr:helicase [Halobacillus fulvus]